MITCIVLGLYSYHFRCIIQEHSDDSCGVTRDVNHDTEVLHHSVNLNSVSVSFSVNLGHSSVRS